MANVIKPKISAARKLSSDVWNHYHKKDLGGGFKQAVCKYCGHKNARVSSKTGTGNLKRNLDSCARKNSHDISELIGASWWKI